MLAHIARAQEGEVLGPGPVCRRRLCVARPRPLQGHPLENTGREPSLCTQLRLRWGSYHHYRVWVCLSSKQEQYLRAHNKPTAKQMQQISECVRAAFQLPPNARGRPLLVPEALLPWVGDEHPPHPVAEQG